MIVEKKKPDAEVFETAKDAREYKSIVNKLKTEKDPKIRRKLQTRKSYLLHKPERRERSRMYRDEHLDECRQRAREYYHNKINDGAFGEQYKLICNKRSRKRKKKYKDMQNEVKERVRNPEFFTEPAVPISKKWNGYKTKEMKQAEYRKRRLRAIEMEHRKEVRVKRERNRDALVEKYNKEHPVKPPLVCVSCHESLEGKEYVSALPFADGLCCIPCYKGMIKLRGISTPGGSVCTQE